MGEETSPYLQNIHYQPQLSQLIDMLSNVDEKNGLSNMTISYLEDGSLVVAYTKVVTSVYFWDNIRCQFMKQRTRNNKYSRVAEKEVQNEEESAFA